MDDVTEPARDVLRKRRRPLPPARPGDTRFWCSCDTERQHPYYTSAALIEHINEARAAHNPVPR